MTVNEEKKNSKEFSDEFSTIEDAEKSVNEIISHNGVLSSFFKQPALKRARKVIILVFGLTLFLVGVAMIVLPGPALVVIPLSLAVLGTEFVWAKRWLNKLKAGANNLKERGKHL